MPPRRKSPKKRHEAPEAMLMTEHGHTKQALQRQMKDKEDRAAKLDAAAAWCIGEQGRFLSQAGDMAA